MVLDFADEATEDVFHGNRSKAARRCPPPEPWPAARSFVELDDASASSRPRGEPRHGPHENGAHLRGLRFAR
jgi:hypothetical protein